MYDRLNKTHLREYEQRKYNARRILEVVKQYCASNTLVDVGCGAGQFLDVGQNEQGMKVVGVDGFFDTVFSKTELMANLTRLDLASETGLEQLASMGRFDLCVC